jgi:hypothetical protein
MPRASDEFEFRPYQPSDAAQVLEVLRSAYGVWPRFDIDVDAVDHLRWQLESPAGSGESANWVAAAGDRLASIHVGYPRKGQLNGREISLWFGADSATASDFQGHGLYTSLRERWLEDARLSHDLFATSPVNPVVIRRLDREELSVSLGNPIRLRVKVLDAKKLARASHTGRGIRNLKLVRVLAFEVLKLFGLVKRRLMAGRYHGVEAHRIDRFDERVDALWSEVRRSFDFVLERRADFLNWRYCDRRAGDYAVFVCEEDGKLLGYGAVKVSQDRAYLDDLCVSPGRDDIVSGLISAAEACARQRGAAALHCQMVRVHPFNRVLADHGFVDARLTFNFVCMPLRVDLGEVAVLQRPDAALHLTGGDLV